MSFTWMMIGRFNREGAQQVAEHGLRHAHDTFARAIARSPANGTITSFYAIDSHDWDVAIIGEVQNDDPAYWAKVQILGKPAGMFERTKLLRLATLEAVEAAA